MIDVVDVKTRSRMMSNIRSKNTSPELLIRKALHARGFRYRVHAKNLPGTPDLVLPKYKAVILVHGCFWHGCPRCYRAPKQNATYWTAKVARNMARDRRLARELRQKGWCVVRLWEHQLKDGGRAAEKVATALS